MANRNITFRSAGRFRARIPFLSPRSDGEHAANWSALSDMWNAAPFNYRFGWRIGATGAGQAIATGTVTNVQWNVDQPSAATPIFYNGNGFFDSAVANDSVRVPPGGSGEYMVGGLIEMNAASDYPEIGVALNGNLFAIHGLQVLTSRASTRLHVTLPMSLNDGDTVAIIVAHLSAGSVNITQRTTYSSANFPAPMFWGTRVALFG